MGTPSVKKLRERLELSDKDAKALKTALAAAGSGWASDRDKVDAALELANTLMNGHGVEAIRDNAFEGYYADIGLLYVNMGDTYDTTLIFDTRSRQWRLASWGNVVEAQERRFRE